MHIADTESVQVHLERICGVLYEILEALQEVKDRL